jgi:hypothetical protein
MEQRAEVRDSLACVVDAVIGILVLSTRSIGDIG